MRKLIILPGRMDSSFFLNELEILKREFNKIVIISYPVSNLKYKEIVNKYNIPCVIVEKKLSLWTIRKAANWLKKKEVKKEIKEHFKWSVKGLLSIAYIFAYGIFAIQANDVIEKEVENEPNEAEIVLYSYWLSRPAYAASYFYSMHKERIKKVISRAHGYDLYEYRNHLQYLPFRDFIDHQLDMIFFISKDGMQYYQDKRRNWCRNVGQASLLVSYLGTYNVLGMHKQLLEKKTVVIASCSSISPVKRLDLIISVLEHMPDINIKWIHIGVGKLYKEISGLARERLRHVDTIFMGEVDNKEIIQIYMREDVDYFINLSDSEGLPVSIMEAMSVGIPVIARDVGGIREIVNDRTGCLLENEQDYKRIYDFLTLRINQKETYLQYSQEAFHFWECSFNGEKNYKQFVEKIN